MKPMLVAMAAAAVASPAFAQAGGGMQAMSGMQGMDQGAMIMADGEGTVKALDLQAGTVTIQHGAIAALKWPAMTMTFKAANPGLLRGVRVGQTARFRLMQMGGAISLTAIQPE
jgi:Cu(I)/Ag(I) efflux system protein CusF